MKKSFSRDIIFTISGVSDAQVAEATELADGRGIDRPLREGADNLIDDKFMIDEDEPPADVVDKGRSPPKRPKRPATFQG